MMERGQFDDLVESIERRFQDRPDALSSHTWRWLILGYSVVIFLTALLIGGGVAIFTAGIFTPGAGFLLLLLGGAMITFGLGQVGALIFGDMFEPRGRVLKDGESPELRKLIALLCREIGSPLPDQILLNEDFNAAIVQQPRLGIFGWSKSWMILGLPLLLSASPQEVASVLAHECGHLSMKHGRQGNRIYLMHQSWEKLFQKLQQKATSGFMRFAGTLVLKFLNWYWPRFHARAFLLSRQNEFMADRRAVEATNADYAASALWRIDCTAYMMEHEFWKQLWDEAAILPEPPTDLCARLRTAFHEAPASPGARRWCEYAMQRVSNTEESHPSLSERLRAIGVDAQQKNESGFPKAPALNAAEGLLTDDLPAIEADINDLWRNNVIVIWRDRHRRISAVRDLAEDIVSEAEQGDRTPAELWNETRAILDAQGLEAAEPKLRRLLALDPQHVGATFALGQLRLNHGHADGETLLQHVVGLQTAEWTQPAGAVLERHLATTGQKDAMKELRQQMDKFEQARISAEKERREVSRADAFTHHELSNTELQNLKAVIQKQKACSRAALVQKQVKHFPEEKLFVLSIDAGKRAGGRADKNDQMVTPLMLAAELPGRIFVVTPTGEFKSVANKILKEPAWQIFDRDEYIEG